MKKKIVISLACLCLIFNANSQTWTSGTNSLSTNGNVGIGLTPAVNYPLDIFKTYNGLSMLNMLNNSTTTGSGTGLRLQSSQLGGGGSWYSTITMQADKKLHIDLETRPNAMVFDLAGNIGMGTVNPTIKLSVGSATSGESIGFEPYTFFNTAYSSGFASISYMVKSKIGSVGYQKSTSISAPSSIIEVGSDIKFATKASDALVSGTNWDLNGNTKMIINNKGNVGINTLAPECNLHVAASVNNAFAAKISNNGGNGSGLLITAGSVQSTSTYGMLDVQDWAGKSYLRVSGSNGATYAREIIVTTANFPDYVFQPTYQLMPLKNVEDYIKLNGHLPNVEKAAVFHEEGINLGEMDKKLMEKVEELTLYIIQQQKDIDELKLQIMKK